MTNQHARSIYANVIFFNDSNTPWLSFGFGVSSLNQSKILTDAGVMIIGGRYDLDTGVVEVTVES